MRSARSGFTLLEAMVGVAIAAILAFAFYATIGGGSVTSSDADDRAARASEAAGLLFELASSIAALETTNPPVSFLQTVGAYPNTLSQLTTPITTSQRNSCDRPADAYSGAAIPADGVAPPGYVLGWTPPYFTLEFVAGGTTQIAKGFVAQDDMIRVPAFPPGNNPSAPDLAGRLLIRMNGVTQADAVALDAAVDRTIDNAAGTVRYTAADPTVVDYELRVSGC